MEWTVETSGNLENKELDQLVHEFSRGGGARGDRKLYNVDIPQIVVYNLTVLKSNLFCNLQFLPNEA